MLVGLEAGWATYVLQPVCLTTILPLDHCLRLEGGLTLGGLELHFGHTRHLSETPERLSDRHPRLCGGKVTVLFDYHESYVSPALQLGGLAYTEKS
jgi:hypothetical protein